MSRTVGDIMTREVITLTEEDNLADLEWGMDEYRLRHLPVVNGKKLVGLISHRDLLRFSVSELDKTRSMNARDRSWKRRTLVSDVMTRDLHTVAPDTPLLQAVRMILAGKFGCLPVVDELGELVGIVSEQDLLRELAQNLQREAIVEMGQSPAPR